MKTMSFGKWVGAVTMAVLPLVGCAPKSAQSAPAAQVNTQAIDFDWQGADLELLSPDTNVPGTNGAEVALESAPAELVSTAMLPTNRLSAPAVELVKLAHAGVDESVMLAFVTNSTFVFGLTSEDIIYLNDVGVPESVVTALLQRDQTIRTEITQTTSTPPVYTNELVPAPGAPTPYPEAETTVSQAPVQYVEQQQPSNVSYTYFYDSLAPYGNWVDVAGYGLCWQPSVVVVNRNWQPYSDRGRWVYSDYGWYWASDYSWGWAPFHYGRWFRHNRWGWCWAPDTVWGPSWVSWRHTHGYYGWAPLPPAACYTPGFGFTYYGRRVGFSFGFGLTANHFTFVPSHRFYDRHPHRHRLHREEHRRAFDSAVVVNNVVRDQNHRIINRGIPVEHVSAATGTPIRPVRIRQSEMPVRTQLTRGPQSADRTLTVYRPNLPQPERNTTLVGEGVRPAARDMVRRSTTAGGGPDLNFAPNRDLSFGGAPQSPRISRVEPSRSAATGNTPSRTTQEPRTSIADVPSQPGAVRPPGRITPEQAPNTASRATPNRTATNPPRELTRNPTTPTQVSPRGEVTAPTPSRDNTPGNSLTQRQPVQQQPAQRTITTPTQRPDQRVFPRQTPAVGTQPQAIQQPSAPIQRQAPAQAPAIQRQAPAQAPVIQRQPPAQAPVIQRQAPAQAPAFQQPTIQQPTIQQRQQPIRVNPSIQRSAPTAPQQPAVRQSAPSIQSQPAPSAPISRQSVQSSPPQQSRPPAARIQQNSSDGGGGRTMGRGGR